MALRNNPYLPLYVQDFMTDEKLMECSAEATGIYIRLMCLMHKSEQYGIILLKQKYKQTDDQIENFALQLARYFPYDSASIRRGISELIDENVIEISEDIIIQKRMVKDNEISEKRAISGRSGGNSTQKNKPKPTKKKIAKAKTEANTDIDIDIENENEIDIEGELLNNFNSVCEKLPKVKILTDARKTKLRNRIKEFGADQVKAIFEDVSKSNFLNGENNNNWTATFDWILEPKNFTKILEGNYKNKEQNGNSNTGQSNSNSTNAGFSNQKGNSNGSSKVSGKVSASSILARQAREQFTRNSESGDTTIEVEVVG